MLEITWILILKIYIHLTHNINDAHALCKDANVIQKEKIKDREVILIIIIIVIYKCYFSGELIALSNIKKNKKKRCEHRIRKNEQIKSTVHDANKKMK